MDGTIFEERERERERERDYPATAGPRGVTAPRPRAQAGPPSPPDRLPPRRGGRSSPSTYAASAAGGPAGSARLLGARPGLVRSVRALAAAALLALAGALVLPATADAQTATTLVSNIGQGSTSSATRSARVAQGFTTGSNQAGYVLTRVEVVSATATTFTMRVCEINDATGLPHSSICTQTVLLGGLSGPIVGTQSFINELPSYFPIVLERDTTYFVVMSPSGDSQGYGVTTLDTEDAAKADGWSMADGSLFEDSAGDWESSDDALRIAIKGTVTPAPAVNVAPASAEEGENVIFTVTLTESVGFLPDVRWHVSIESDDTAIVAGVTGDLRAHQLSGSVRFRLGSTTGTFPVPTVEDMVFEGDETFTVTLEAVEGVELGESSTAKGTILNDDERDTTAPSITEVTTFADGRIIALVYDAPYEDPMVIGPVGQTPVQQADPVPEAYADAFSLSINGVAVNTEPPYVDRTRGRPIEVRFRLAGRKDWPPGQGLVRYLPGQALVLSYDASKASIGDRSGNQVASFTTGSGGVPAIVNNSTVTPGTRATLRALRVGPYTSPIAPVTPPFAPDTTSYAATVGYNTTNVGIAAGRDEGLQRVEFLDADDNTIEDANATWYGAAGFVNLAVGENVIKVRVTAEDGDATRTYTLTVTREGLVNARPPAGTAGLLEVYWTEPTGDAYEVRYWPADEDGRTRRIQRTTDQSQSILLWPLAAATEYKVQVRARSAEGWSDWSETATGRTGTAQSGRPVLSLHLLDGSDNEIEEGAITEGDTVRYRIKATNVRNYHDWGNPAMLGRFWLNAHVERDRHVPSPWLQSSLDGDHSTSHISCGDLPLLRAGLSDTQPDFQQTSATTGYWDLETEPFPVGYAEHGPVTLSIQRGDCGGDATVSGTVHPPDPRDPDIGGPSSACVTIADNGEGPNYDYTSPTDTVFTAKPTYSCSGQRSPQRSLQGRFVSAPERHDGTGRVNVRVAFSEPVAESPENVGEHGVEVEGGEVTSVSPVGGTAPGGAGTRSVGGRNAGREDREVVWEFEIEPDSDGDVTVSLDAGRPCDEEGAICTADGRSLSEDISTTVEGPETDEGPPPLTASFEDLPGEHDGESAFRFRVAFSEKIAISYRSLREDAFAVTGGRVTRGKRVDGRKDLFEITVDPDGTGEVAISLPAGRECEVSGAICTWGPPRKQLTNTPAATVAGPPVEPLTASFEGVPAEHDGETAFKLRIAFSEPLSWMNSRRLREHVVAVAGGRATKAGRVNRRRDLWKLTVEPDSLADVTVTLAAGAACRTPAAVCTSDGRALSTTIATTVRGPVAVSVADARAEEGTDATLDFAVTLSRAASGTVAVAYATADGTATAGADYTARKGQLTFDPGETATTVRVPVLDDAHDEGEETLTLRLSAASGAVLADGTATGTIVNSDKLQQAWLARFGRTVATHVTDAVGDRLRGTPGQESHLTVGGYRLPVGQRGATDGAEDGVSGVERLVLALGQRLGLGRGTAPSGSAGTGTGPWAASQADPDPRLVQSRTLDLGSAVNLRQVLLGSSFRLALGGDAVGASRLRLTAWGRVAGTTFDGRDGDLSLDGDVLTGTVGVDGEWDRLLAGLAVAHSRGDGSFSMTGLEANANGQGELETTLTSVHPYLRYAVNDRLAVWGLLGFGTGQMELEVANGEIRETDTDLLMGAFGGRGILLAAPESGGFQLATRTDAMLTRTTSDAVQTADGNMASGEADAHRLRLVLEGSRGVTWAEGRRLTPTMELGLRHDWGDAETGFGLELGGRVQYADPALGLTIDATVRGLLAHEDSDYEEWGASGTVRVAPGAGGQGLALTLAPTWGAASSGVDGLWSRQTTAGLAPQGTRVAPVGRLTAEIGYGVAAPFGTGLLTPYAGTVLTEGAARTYRVGTRLQLGRPGATGLTLNLEGTRQEPAGPQPATQGLRLQATWGF